MGGGSAIIADIQGNYFAKSDFESQIKEVTSLKKLHNILKNVAEAEITLKNKVELNKLIEQKFKSL